MNKETEELVYKISDMLLKHNDISDAFIILDEVKQDLFMRNSLELGALKAALSEFKTKYIELQIKQNWNFDEVEDKQNEN